MTRRFVGLAIVLGLITAVGPFAIDMYLPALPTIGQALQASPAAVQMSLMIYFITVGVFQLPFGPLTDIAGRKTPLYAGLGLFIAGSIGCALSPNIESLIFFRFVQALGACAGIVVPRAVVRDLYTGPDAARLMSMLMLVMSISPILAPLTGSFVIDAFGWRGVFWGVAVTASIATFLAATCLAETRPAHLRLESSWSASLAAYQALLADPRFMGLVFVGAFGISAFFIYLAGSSFVIVGHYGLSARDFALLFSLNAASFFACSQLTGVLTHRFGLARVIRAAVVGFAAVMATGAVYMSSSLASLPAMIAFLMAGFGFLGLVLPSASVLALEDHGEIAGTASALMGALHMITGAAVMAVAGLVSDGSPGPMVACIAVSAALSAVISGLTLGRRRRTAAAD